MIQNDSEVGAVSPRCWSHKLRGLFLMESVLSDFEIAWDFWLIPSLSPLQFILFRMGMSPPVVKVQIHCILEAGNTGARCRGRLSQCVS